MYEQDEVVGKAHARGIAHKAEPILERFLMEAALHLLEGIAQAADARQKIESEVEALCCHTWIVLRDGCAEILLVGVLEVLDTVVEHIIIIWAEKISVEREEVTQKPVCLVLPFGEAHQRKAIFGMLLAELLEASQQDV